MPFKNYRQQSRDVQWGGNFIGDDTPGLEQINCGSLLRIADATELMARSHVRLIQERDEFERRMKAAHVREARLQRCLSAAKGQITKLKNKLTVKP